nr:glycerol-3-phosphate dehydrogenase/oxidase [Tautonia sociabilis]
MIDRLSDPAGRWDVLVIGGGATGLGVAVDSAARGYRTALVERLDFGQGTSSRSTKLVHGGVRYLRQGNVFLVVEALRERATLLRLAPHLVSPLRFVVPSYSWWEGPYYGAGLKAYDLLAGRRGLEPSRWLSAREAAEALPTIRTEGLRGGVRYVDGLFDDARLLVALARTAAGLGATVVNYVRVDRLLKGEGGRVEGVAATDVEASRALTIRAKVVVNATGPFSDDLRREDDPGSRPIISPSRGSHVVLPRRFLPGDSALMIPRTPDGRVLFAIPWHDRVVLGTTDSPVDLVPIEPRPTAREVDFLLETAAGYLAEPPALGDVRSCFAGIRPLVRSGEGRNTARLSRDHHLEVSPSGLVTICGGKWTTYRKMAEVAVSRAAEVAGLPRLPCPTADLPIQGHREGTPADDPMAVYGSDAEAVVSLSRERPGLADRLHPALPIIGAEVAWAARREMARTVEDVLCRRTRAAFLDAEAAEEMAPAVASLLAAELGRDPSWEEEQVAGFRQAASAYRPDRA